MTILPTPSGTRDVLPDEARELRAITNALREVFEEHGYGEVMTPALEYEDVLRPAGARPAYRVVDDHGDVLVLRSDMTVPIARVAATRYASAEPPMRFSYVATAYRQVRPHRGMQREHLQAGIELIGASAPEGTAEALTVLCRALDATGLRGYRVGLGSAALFPRLLDGLGVGEEARRALMEALLRHDFVALEGALAAAGLSPADAELIQQVATTRGSIDLLTSADGALSGAVAGLRDVVALLDDDIAERVLVDLGLVREMGYYTGAIFEVYDPALGAPIGGGGRYDDLLGKFGRSLPAAGFALKVDRLHLALAGEERDR